ncbi:MAG: hypothetical protein JOZ87_33395 [Chloroflexi bacterium]|nr:hypothetical protein [Chloroflexota bacterium]
MSLRFRSYIIHQRTGCECAASNLPVVHVGAATSIGPDALAFQRGYFAQLGVPTELGPQISTGDVKLRVAALLSGQLDAAGMTVDAGLFNAAGPGRWLQDRRGRRHGEPWRE